jgi:hypothetical protein
METVFSKISTRRQPIAAFIQSLRKIYMQFVCHENSIFYSTQRANEVKRAGKPVHLRLSVQPNRLISADFSEFIYPRSARIHFPRTQRNISGLTASFSLDFMSCVFFGWARCPGE